MTAAAVVVVVEHTQVQRETFSMIAGRRKKTAHSETRPAGRCSACSLASFSKTNLPPHFVFIFKSGKTGYHRYYMMCVYVIIQINEQTNE